MTSRLLSRYRMQVLDLDKVADYVEDQLTSLDYPCDVRALKLCSSEGQGLVLQFRSGRTLESGAIVLLRKYLARTLSSIFRIRVHPSNLLIVLAGDVRSDRTVTEAHLRLELNGLSKKTMPATKQSAAEPASLAPVPGLAVHELPDMLDADPHIEEATGFPPTMPFESADLKNEYALLQPRFSSRAA